MSRAYATMSVSVCRSVRLSVTEVHWRIINQSINHLFAQDKLNGNNTYMYQVIANL